MTTASRPITTGRTVGIVLALTATAVLLSVLSSGIDVARPGVRVVLVAGPVATLAVPLVRGRAAGALAGSALAVAVALVARADVVALGLLGTALLLIIGLVEPESGVRIAGHLGRVVLLGAVATLVVGAALGTTQVPAVVAAVAAVALAGVGVVVVRALQRAT